MKKTTSMLFAAVLLMVTLFGCSNGPDKVAKKFLEAQEKKDFKAMKDLSTKDSEKMIGLIEGLSTKDSDKTKSGPYTIKNTEISGDTTALITYCCDPSAKDGGDSKLHMRKTPEGWKVDMSKETLMGGKNLMDMMNVDDAKKADPGTDVDSASKTATDTTKH